SPDSTVCWKSVTPLATASAMTSITFWPSTPSIPADGWSLSIPVEKTSTQVAHPCRKLTDDGPRSSAARLFERRGDFPGRHDAVFQIQIPLQLRGKGLAQLLPCQDLASGSELRQ